MRTRRHGSIDERKKVRLEKLLGQEVLEVVKGTLSLKCLQARGSKSRPLIIAAINRAQTFLPTFSWTGDLWLGLQFRLTSAAFALHWHMLIIDVAENLIECVGNSKEYRAQVWRMWDGCGRGRLLCENFTLGSEANELAYGLVGVGGVSETYNAPVQASKLTMPLYIDAQHLAS